jgi:hypothetical protein
VPILPPPGGFGAIFDFWDFQKGIFWPTFSRKNRHVATPPNAGKRLESDRVDPWRDLRPNMVPRRPETRFPLIL